jgi:sugar phosphate isomerase/epimerase
MGLIRPHHATDELMTTATSTPSPSETTLSLGMIVDLSTDIENRLAQVSDLGLTSIQLASWQPADLTPDAAATVCQAADREGLMISSFWAGYSGPAVWDFLDGPATIGLVPNAYRENRVNELIAATDFARAINAPSITTHLGFLPEDPSHPDYEGTLQATRRVADAAASRGLGFWFETGQETPVTLWRFIHDLNAPHVGVNFDPANLILYGKANPLDALDILGPWVRGFHAKDGRYPAADPRKLGEETPLGHGSVDFNALLKKLKALDYRGAITIEREIEGPQQLNDIRASIRTLETLL